VGLAISLNQDCFHLDCQAKASSNLDPSLQRIVVVSGRHEVTLWLGLNQDDVQHFVHTRVKDRVAFSFCFFVLSVFLCQFCLGWLRALVLIYLFR
jgi:hypothetical protein